jgi:predicted enzyme related to lactoylglutathione lyase
MTNGRVARWQILSKSPAKAASFYSDLFDWQIHDDNRLGYLQAHTPQGGLDGGFWPSPQPSYSAVTLYVEVDDLQAAVNKAKALGSTVLMPPQTLPDGDAMAIVLDPDGLALGLCTLKATADRTPAPRA